MQNKHWRHLFEQDPMDYVNRITHSNLRLVKAIARLKSCICIVNWWFIAIINWQCYQWMGPLSYVVTKRVYVDDLATQVARSSTAMVLINISWDSDSLRTNKGWFFYVFDCRCVPKCILCTGSPIRPCPWISNNIKYQVVPLPQYRNEETLKNVGNYIYIYIYIYITKIKSSAILFRHQCVKVEKYLTWDVRCPNQ